MENLEILVANDFDMIVQKDCTGSCTSDCQTQDGHCDCNNTCWW